MEQLEDMIINEKVRHKRWGDGTVVEIKDGNIYVMFYDGLKQFPMSVAFEKYLRFVDPKCYKQKYLRCFPNQIVSEIEKRRIKYFIHFTRIENLDYILQYGLLPISELKKRNIQYIVNDVNRFDNHRNANSLSISFPNYRMFYKYREQDIEKKWVVIIL